MEKAIQKAKALIEAMEYIRRFRDRIIVVKLGGSVLDDMELQTKLLTDIVFMATVGMRPIIVHGGGKTITKAMSEAGLEPVWVQGLRYTDERTLTIAEQTLVHKVNTPICKTLKELGCDSMGYIPWEVAYCGQRYSAQPPKMDGSSILDWSVRWLR